MAICSKTGKRSQVGNNVSHANNKTKRRVKANLQKIRVVLPNGQVKRMYVSTRAIRSGMVKRPAPRVIPPAVGK